MQARTDPEEWVGSEGLPSFFRKLILVAVASTVFLAGVLFLVPGALAALGLVPVVLLVALSGIFDVGMTFWFAQTMWPRAVRATPAGIEVRRRWGPVTSIPWQGSEVGPSAAGSAGEGTGSERTGFLVLRWRTPSGGPGGFVILSVRQEMMLRSSPHRPSEWPRVGPTTTIV